MVPRKRPLSLVSLCINLLHRVHLSTWRPGPLIEVMGMKTRWSEKGVIITNQALVDREGSLYYYLPLTPRVSLPPPPQSAVQVATSMCASESAGIKQISCMPQSSLIFRDTPFFSEPAETVERFFECIRKREEYDRFQRTSVL